MRFTWKLLISTYILVLITLCASSTILIYSMFDNEMQKEITEAENGNTMMRMGIHTLVEEYDKSMYGVQVGVLEGVLKRLEVNWKNENRQFAIIDLKGNVISSNRLFAGYGTVREIPKDEQELIYKTYKSGKSYYIQMCTRLNLEEKSILIINTQDITKTYTLREEMLNVSSVITLCMVMVFGAVNIGIVKVLLKPIHEMTEATEKIVQGDLEIRVQEGSKDELGMLARRFNLMTEHVQKNIQDLEEYARRQENFVGSFSHELKTPLTSIIGYADLMRTRKLDEETYFLAANYIFEEGKRLESLSFKMLELLVEKNTAIMLEKISVKLLLEDSLYIVREKMKEKNVQVIIEDNSFFVSADIELMKTVLSNLLENARKAVSENGEIRVSAEQINNRNIISIEDNGRGIPKEELGKIEEAFYRVDKSRSRLEGGFGLGLSVCSQIMMMHQGEMLFESEVGKGTKVSVIWKEDCVKD